MHIARLPSTYLVAGNWGQWRDPLDKDYLTTFGMITLAKRIVGKGVKVLSLSLFISGLSRMTMPATGKPSGGADDLAFAARVVVP